MDMRLSVIRSDTGSTLKVAGKLTGSRVPLLERTAASLAKPLAVDLSDLVALDEEGVQALGRLRDAGAELRGLSPFIALSLGLGEDRAGSR